MEQVVLRICKFHLVSVSPIRFLRIFLAIASANEDDVIFTVSSIGTIPISISIPIPIPPPSPSTMFARPLRCAHPNHLQIHVANYLLELSSVFGVGNSINADSKKFALAVAILVSLPPLPSPSPSPSPQSSSLHHHRYRV